MVNRGSGRAISLLTATLAATLILTFLTGCSPVSRGTSSQPGVAANVISPHLSFGNPSDAGGDPNNHLVLRQQFAASWNAKKRIANWVAWRLAASDIGDTERSQFYADHEISTPSPKDYTNSGYDRGHICPSKDRSDTPGNNQAVFTMLNILPQSPDNNRGPWEKAERFERELAQAGREVYVIAGGVGSQANFHGITAPDSTWKVIVALERGKDFPDGQEKAQVFAVIVPNQEGIRDDRWQQYQTSVAEIEQKTGYRFFRNSAIIESIAKKAGRL
jgi:endonuclease G